MSCDTRHSLVNRTVQFKVCDVFIPEPRDLLWDMYSGHILEGKVVFQSEADDGDQVVAVQIEGVPDKLFIPVKKLTCM